MHALAFEVTVTLEEEREALAVGLVSSSSSHGSHANSIFHLPRKRLKNPRCFTESKGKICVKTLKSLKDYPKSHEPEALGRASVEEFGAGP